MPNAEKVDKVEALKERIEGSSALLLAEYRGLTVHDTTELRRSLIGQARFAVTKNTLLRRAAGDAGIEGLDALLSGPTAVAFVEGDVVATAKKLVEAAKKHPALLLKGAYMDGQVLGAEAARALADLESREVMLSKIAGLLKGEMSRAASMFQALQSQFVGLMEALRDKKPAEPEAETAEAEPEAEAAEAEPAPAEAEAEPEAQPETAEAQAAEAEPAAEAQPEPDVEAQPETAEPEAQAETAEPEPEASTDTTEGKE